ncbi:unnamed protein product, partial [Staurois parvus]
MADLKLSIENGLSVNELMRLKRLNQQKKDSTTYSLWSISVPCFPQQPNSCERG